MKISVIPKRQQNIITCCSIGIIVFLFYQLTLPYHLFLREESQLFILSSDYILEYFKHPAPLSSLIADFITQFFYFRYAGATIIALIAIIEWLAWQRLLIKTAPNAFEYAIIPTVFDIFWLCDTTQSIALPIGNAIAIFLLLLIDKCRTSKIIFNITISITTILATWLLGISFIIAIIPLTICKKEQHDGRIFTLIKCILLWLLTTIIFRHVSLLPLSTIIYSPATLLYSIFMLIISISASFIARYTHNKILLYIITYSIIFCVITFQANFKAEKLYAIDIEYYLGNHKKVRKLINQNKDSKNEIISYYTNLEDINEGTISDNLLKHYQPFERSLFRIPSPNMSWHEMLISYEAFAKAGCHNWAQHAALLANTFSPRQRSVRAIKRLAESNIIVNDTLAAKKYFLLLQKTFFNKRLHIKQPTIKSKNDNYQMAFASDIETMLNQMLDITNDQATLDYLLCFYLLKKDIESFIKTIRNHTPTYIGRYYKEAILIAMVQSNNNQIVNITIDDKLHDEFIDYTKLYKEGNKKELKNKYVQTYWYYYHHAIRNEKE